MLNVLGLLGVITFLATAVGMAATRLLATSTVNTLGFRGFFVIIYLIIPIHESPCTYTLK